MEIEFELYHYFSSIAETANSMNDLSLHLNFSDQEKELLNFMNHFEDLIRKHRDSVSCVLDLFVAYRQSKIIS